MTSKQVSLTLHDGKRFHDEETKIMAAISALQTYGSDSDSSDNGSETETREPSADATAHLRPLESGSQVTDIQKRIQIDAAPVVDNKVNKLIFQICDCFMFYFN